MPSYVPLQGDVEIERREGVRTREEIERERYKDNSAL